MKSFRLFTFLVLAVVALGGCATTATTDVSAEVSSGASLPSGVPLPPDLKIVPPGPEIDPVLACFSSIWKGVWSVRAEAEPYIYIIEHVLVVEELRRSDARVVYAWGRIFAFKPGWARNMAAFIDGELKLVIPSHNAIVTYRMNPNGTISAHREEPGAVSTATLVKVKGEKEEGTKCKH